MDDNATSKVGAVVAPSEIADRSTSRWYDARLAFALAIAAAFGCCYTSGIARPMYQTNDFWFDSDNRTILTLLSDRWATQHHRSAKHPLFGLVAFPTVQVIHRAGGLEIEGAIRVFNSLTAAVWIATIFCLLRRIGLRRLDATIFAVLAATSAAAIFWFSVPETFPLGSLTILLMLLAVAIDQRRPLSPWWYVIASAATLSITVTNWMTGWIAAALRFPPRRAVQITVNAFCIVAVLFGLQKYLTPRAEYFIGDRKAREFVLREEAGGPLVIARAELCHSMVAAEMSEIDRESAKGRQLLTMQRSGIGSSGPIGLACTIAWLALLAVGFYAMIMKPANDRFRNVLGLTLLGQLGLHQVFGTETFLYTLHCAPLLVITAAGACFTRFRWPVLAAAALLAVGLAVHNVQQLRHAVSLLDPAAIAAPSNAAGLGDPQDAGDAAGK